MPLDTNIMLQGKAPVPYDPLANQLKAMSQETQLGSLLNTQTQNQIVSQQQQTQLHDTQVMRQAHIDSGGDLQEMSRRIHGQVDPGTEAAFNESVAKMIDAGAAAGEAQTKRWSTKAQTTSNILNGMNISDPDSVNTTVQQLYDSGAMDGNEIQRFWGSLMKDPQGTITQYQNSAVTAQQLADMADKKRARQLAEFEEQRKEAQESRTEQLSGFALREQQIKTSQAEAEKSASDSWLAKPENNGKTIDDYKVYLKKQEMMPQDHPIQIDIDGEPMPAVQRIMPDGSSKIIYQGKEMPGAKMFKTPTINMTVPGLGPSDQAVKDKATTGEEYLAMLPPGTAAQVRAIADGRTTMPPFGTRGASAQLRDAVFRYDPGYSEQRAQIRKAFTTGPDGKNIGSLNTATVHLDMLSDAAQALSNGTFTPGNQAWNNVKAVFGSAELDAA